MARNHRANTGGIETRAKHSDEFCKSELTSTMARRHALDLRFSLLMVEAVITDLVSPSA